MCCTNNLNAPTILAIWTFHVVFSVFLFGCFDDFGAMYFNVGFTRFDFSGSSLASNMSAKFDFLLRKMFRNSISL